MRKTFYIILGFIATGLGAIGTLLPVLPTTPFLLLAAWSFGRGSTRFDTWFKQTSLYRNHLEDFVQYRQMKQKTKITLVSFASAMMLTSALLSHKPFVKVLLYSLTIYLFYYFRFRIKTVSTRHEYAVF